jgi:hypothetical protein
VNSLKLSRRLLRSSTEKAAEVLYRADLWGQPWHSLHG